MRVLFLGLDIDLARNRGDSIHALNLAKSLVHVGHSVLAVVGAAPSQRANHGVEIAVRPSARDPVVLRYLLRLARKFRPDLIYERRFSPKMSAAIATLLDIPYIIEINGILEDEARLQGLPVRKGPIAAIKKGTRHLLLRKASGIVAVTPELRTCVISLYGATPSKVHVVPNGVDPAIFRPLDKKTARQELGIPEGPVACFVGNFVKWHDFGTLIEAMRIPPSQFHLIAVGDGPEREKLEAMAKRFHLSPRISFVGELPHWRVPAFIAASDVAVAPATRERNQRVGSSALKLYEYLSCARPLIATAIPGVTNLIGEYRCGIAVPPGDPTALGRAIEKVLSEPAFQEAALRASESIRTRFSWDETARGVSAVMDQVVSESLESHHT